MLQFDIRLVFRYITVCSCCDHTIIQQTNIKKEGSLEKLSRFVKVWKERWTVLQYDSEENNHYLFTYDPEKKYTEPTETIRIDTVTDIHKFDNKEQDPQDVMFYIENQKNKDKFQFRAKTTQERDEWILSIQTAKSITVKQHNEDNTSNINDSFPVFPLIIPNNCTYDEKTNKMRVNNNETRDKLVAYKPVKSICVCIRHRAQHAHNNMNNPHTKGFGFYSKN